MPCLWCSACSSLSWPCWPRRLLWLHLSGCGYRCLGPLPCWRRFVCACCPVCPSFSVSVLVPPKSCQSCFSVSPSLLPAQPMAQISTVRRDDCNIPLYLSYSVTVVGGKYNQATRVPAGPWPGDMRTHQGHPGLVFPKTSAKAAGSVKLPSGLQSYLTRWTKRGPSQVHRSVEERPAWDGGGGWTRVSCRWGNLCSKGVIPTNLKFIFKFEGQWEGMDAFAAPTRWWFKLHARISQQKGHKGQPGRRRKRTTRNGSRHAPATALGKRTRARDEPP